MALKQLVVRLGQAYPEIANPIWKSIFPLFRKDELWAGTEYTDSASETFSTIYKENRWLSEESKSGDGSTLVQTHFLRKFLPKLMSDLDLTTILDAPCGDFHWMRHVEFDNSTRYIGGDIVPGIIDELQRRHSSRARNFRIIDIVKDKLPEADIWLCRDVLFHLPNDAVLEALHNFAKSGARYLLTTSYDFVSANRDIKAGGFRFINLQQPPFNLPEPTKSIDDYVFPQPPRKLALWSRLEVRRALGLDQQSIK